MLTFFRFKLIGIGCLCLVAAGPVDPTAEGCQTEALPRVVPAHSATGLKLTHLENEVQVEIDGKPFTTYRFHRKDKPILFPVYGPGQVGMTRRWPMETGVQGEADDHPHHQSIWLGHEVNHVDFWANKTGLIRTEKVDLIDDNQTIRSQSNWLRKSDEQPVVDDVTEYRFGETEDSRWIDCQITFLANYGDAEFLDTKEGTFAIRTHPDLRLSPDPNRGVNEVFGHAVNSEGVSGNEIWGKPAKWVLYFGKIDGKPMAMAMYDCPSNLRHPTTWHAREYGLVTANPFGLHYFTGQPEGAGAYTVKQGERLQLRYRIEFFAGNPSTDEVQQRFDAFAKSKL